VTIVADRRIPRNSGVDRRRYADELGGRGRVDTGRRGPELPPFVSSEAANHEHQQLGTAADTEMTIERGDVVWTVAGRNPSRALICFSLSPSSRHTSACRSRGDSRSGLGSDPLTSARPISGSPDELAKPIEHALIPGGRIVSEVAAFSD